MAATVASLIPGLARAQQIGGTVTDSTGALLPGVTVEARSPALIEQVRTVVTNDAGQYLIVALETGVYTVTFTLPGFRTVVREGVRLSTGFTADIDAQLSVGAVQETVTVTSASPIVDVRNVEQRTTMNQEVIDGIPSGKSITGYGLLVPGMVGGEHWGTPLAQDQGGMSVQSRQRMSIHGGTHTDQQLDLNGLDVGDAFSQGANLAFFPDTNFQEMAYQYSGNSADVQTGGVRINMIPKEGGNRFGVQFFSTFTFPGLQANNLDQSQINAGLSDPTIVDQVWSFNENVGGPIVRNRLWFFAAHTDQRAFIYPTGSYWATNPSALVFVPDKSRRVLDTSTAHEQSVNLTWQATSKDKVKFYWTNSSTNQDVYLQGRTLESIFVAPEGAIVSAIGTNIYQASWARPQTSRLLFEAGFSHEPVAWTFDPAVGSITSLPGILQLSPTIATRNMSGWLSGATSRISPKEIQSTHASAAYVTGSHNFKFGGDWLRQWTQVLQKSENWTSLWVLGSSPITAIFWGSSEETESTTGLGLYAQDQWKLKRMTINAGLRYENWRAGYPDQVRPVTTWVTQEFAIPAKTVTNWKDLFPRLGFVYDVSGDSRTALKVSASRYGKRDGTTLAAAVNPAIVNREMRRTWNDRTCLPGGACIAGDGIPQGNPLNPAPNGELLSPNTNLAFGQPIINRFYDPAWAFGWGNRSANWEYAGSVEREVITGVSLNFGYFHRQYVNFSVPDDRALGPADFDQFTVTVPDDPRLPSAGRKITLVDLKPTSIRLGDVVTTSANNLGGQHRSWNGIDFTADARLRGLLLQGGLSWGSLSTDNCQVLASVPEAGYPTNTAADAVPLEYCKTAQNWLTQIKLLGSYALPRDFLVAGTFQNQPGPQRIARVTYTAAQIAAALGRPSTQGAQTVNVVDPGTNFGDRFNQFDLRFTKLFRFKGSGRFRAMFDLYNLFNANSATFEEVGYGTTYLYPQVIMPGRLAKFAFQIDY